MTADKAEAISRIREMLPRFDTEPLWRLVDVLELHIERQDPAPNLRLVEELETAYPLPP